MRTTITIIFLSGQLLAQNIEGVYSGKIFSENNVFVLSTAGDNAVGTIHLNRTDKVAFFGVIEDGKVIGSAEWNDKRWDILGELKGDSLVLQLSYRGDIQRLGLKRLSQKPSYNFNKVLKDSYALDLRLVGMWRLIQVEKEDGTIGPPSPDMKGFAYEFRRDGSCKITFPKLEKMKKDFGNQAGFKVPTSRWVSSGQRLYISTTNSGSTERSYLLRGDTLITIYKGGKNFFLRKP